MASSSSRRGGRALAFVMCALIGGDPEPLHAKVPATARAWDSALFAGLTFPVSESPSPSGSEIERSIRLAAVTSSEVAATSSNISTEAATTGRFLIQVLVPKASLYERPNLEALVVGQVEQGTQLEADRKSGEWYRVKRVGTDPAWILNASIESGTTLAVLPFPAEGRIDLDAANRDPRAPPVLSPEDLAARRAPRDEADVERRRPQGEPLEPRLPLVDPDQVSPPTPFDPRSEMPLRDRWRILKALKLLPYDLRDPYNPNVLKGDLPVLEEQLGPEWFFNLTAISDTVLEARRLPTAVGIQSTRNPGSNNTFGRGNQSTLAQTVIVSLSLIKGDTVFRPPDYEFRFVPVANINRTMTEEVRAVNVDPSFGIDRDDGFVGVQELFFDKHLRDVSTRYDFDSVRLGIQPFTADFRGFLFLDQPFGLRFFGTRDNNRWQYNAGWFRRLEKDTNSGLNDLGKTLRADDVYVANLYRQDWPVLGFTTQGIVLHNRNREGRRGQFYNDNRFLERPAIFGTGRPHNYEVTYVGLNGDGHFGPWNVTASGYYALGNDRRGMLSGRRERIRASFGALELSRDFDWVRVRASALYASGDDDPFDNEANGFDAVLENPLIAGADTSYWIRQAIPFIGGSGTALSIRNGVLASLRTSREHGQSNFTNPGLHLFGIGADFDVKPQLRLLANVNYLEFDNLSSLAALRNQRPTSTRIGVDISVGVQYRPLFIQNVVVNASAAALLPGKGLRELYGNAADGTQYSMLVNVILTY